MANLRKQPFIYVTWLKDFLIGDYLCKWSIWHRIFYDYEKAPSDFDSVRYNMEHTAMRSEVMQRYSSAGYEVIPELSVKVSGEIATLKGKIDLIALREDHPLIIEIKTGTPRPADKIQLLLYLWAIKRAYSRFRDIPFDGLLIYKSHEIEISALEIDESFIKNFQKFMKEILHGEPDRKYPNKNECRFCKIGDCDERLEKEELEESDYISNYF
jgi:CRISPR/Cas system-associated exonuclease Cas4 (RecB family)